MQHATRTFICDGCGQSWVTDAPGNFKKCPGCREAAKAARHQKICRRCQTSFVDTSPKNCQLYCTEECRRRGKIERSGLVPDGGFLADRVLTCEDPACAKSFTPTVSGQRFCSVACRSAMAVQPARTKICRVCAQPFQDTSRKNNQVAHLNCLVPPRKTDVGFAPGPRLEENRRGRVRLKEGGRLDDIATMTKFTATWWGRVSELIFAAYRTNAIDANTENGNKCPYDFEDPILGRVNVKSSQGRASPQGRTMWVFPTAESRAYCDHFFFVAFTGNGTQVAHLWVTPTIVVNDHLVRFAPGSREYEGDKWDVTAEWGSATGDAVLRQCLDLPDPVRVGPRIWVRDPGNFTGDSKAHRGRRGEFLYAVRYPTSVDENARVGMTARWDFTDSDGTKINVKTGRRYPREDCSNVMRWSFSILSMHQVEGGHQCDVYSCLCLDESGDEVLREYRIPASVLGKRRLIHVYEGDDGQWRSYRTAP